MWLLQVRAEIFHTLEGRRDAAVLHPPLCNDNLLINELIREYMSYNGYDSALSVFLAESGQPNDKNLNRTFLRGEVMKVVSVLVTFPGAVHPSSRYIHRRDTEQTTTTRDRALENAKHLNLTGLIDLSSPSTVLVVVMNGENARGQSARCTAQYCCCTMVSIPYPLTRVGPSHALPEAFILTFRTIDLKYCT